MEKKKREREGDDCQLQTMHGFCVGTEIMLEMKDGSVETKDKFSAPSCSIVLL